MHRLRMPWDEYTTSIAAGRGYLQCLSYLHENGCPWTDHTTKTAAAYNQLDCLKYAHEHGCPWSPYVTTTAAIYGNLDCIKYAHEHGCPWNDSTLGIAAMHSQLGCLQYAHQHGCPWDVSSICSHLTRCAIPVSDECILYVYLHGCHQLPQDMIVRAFVRNVMCNVIRDTAARTIQKFWLQRYYDPNRSTCRSRLMREFKELANNFKFNRREMENGV